MENDRSMQQIHYTPIGIVRSPFTEPQDMPVQNVGASGVAGSIELLPTYADGLKDLAGFSHLILIVHFHLCQGYRLEVTPFLDTQPHGLFATRAPCRPNPVGLSLVRLVAVEGCTLQIEDVDVVDRTPLLDIKPYVPVFDSRAAERVGWLAETGEHVYTTRSDRRFAPEEEHGS
jgi:tRNA-Thr(GGU) m(6)t(6)A37 methyltransferase TsaA